MSYVANHSYKGIHHCQHKHFKTLLTTSTNTIHAFSFLVLSLQHNEQKWLEEILTQEAGPGVLHSIWKMLSKLGENPFYKHEYLQYETY